MRHDNMKAGYNEDLIVSLHEFVYHNSSLQVVQKLGGFNRVMNQNQWKIVANKMTLQSLGNQAANLIKNAYKR